MARHKGVPAGKRKKHGATGQGKLKKGSFPVYSKRTARSAIKLRGHSPSKKAVLDKVSRYANKTSDKSLKKAVAKARAKDRGKK